MVIQWLIGNFNYNFVESKQSPADSVFFLNVILNFIATIMDRFGLNKFIATISWIPEDTLMQSKQESIRKIKEQKEAGVEQIETNDKVQKEKELEEKQSLEALILQVVSISHEIELEPLTYINFLSLVRKVIPNDKIITEKQFLIDEILDMAKDKVVLFDKKISAFLKAQTGSQIAQAKHLTIAHLEDQMLSSFSETLMTSTLYMNEETNENSLYILLNSGFQQLQQAAYFMLSHLYRNFIPAILFKKDEEEEIKQLQLMAEG